jgi:hypothetical protein
LAAPHYDIDLAVPGDGLAGVEAIRPDMAAAVRVCSAGMIGPDFGLTSVRMVIRGTHTDQNLLARQANHASARLFSIVGALNCARGKQETYRHCAANFDIHDAAPSREPKIG